MLRTLREAEYVLYKVPYLSITRKKNKKHRISGKGTYLPGKVGKRNEFYSYIYLVYTKREVHDNIGRLNNTLQKKRKKIKLTHE